MSSHWAITVSAGDVDEAARARTAGAMQAWLDGGGDGVALITCHRAELYGVGAPPHIDGSAHLLAGEQATTHLMRVACGLESAIAGEDEVLHQVREAMRDATARRRLDSRMHRLFQSAIATGRSARARRTESSGNLAQSAVRWLQAKADIANRTVVVGGAGRMGATLAHSLANAGANVVVSSRNIDRATRLARLYDARAASLQDGAALVESAVAVAVALAGPWSELQALAPAELPPVADISAPQSVPASVRRRLNGNFLGIDDLYRQTRPLPGAYIKDAEALVTARSAEFTAWLGRAR